MTYARALSTKIVEVEQRGQSRADYGEQVVRALADRLGKQYGRGFSYPSVKRIKQFYLAFADGSAITGPEAGKGSTLLSLSGADQEQSTITNSSVTKKGSTPLNLSRAQPAAPFPPFLSWSHYLVLLRVQDQQARAFYEIEAARESWSDRVA